MLDQWTWWPEFHSWGSHDGRGIDDHKLSSDLDKHNMHFCTPPYMTYVYTCSMCRYMFHIHTCSAVALPDPFLSLAFPPFFNITEAKICRFGLGLWSWIPYALQKDTGDSVSAQLYSWGYWSDLEFSTHWRRACLEIREMLPRECTALVV